MNYRDKLYSEYVSTHTANLYGPQNLESFRNQFGVWQDYFCGFIPGDKRAEIADIGCGNGGFVYWLEQMGYQNVAGVDASKEQVEAAKKLGIKNIIQGDAVKFLSAKKDYYDLLFMRDFIEHFKKEEILEILELAYESLKSGGIIVIQTVNAENPFFGRLAFGDLSHETFFTKESMSQLLLFLKFKNVEIFGTYPVPRGIKSFLRLILQKMADIIFRVYLLAETGSGGGIFSQNIIAGARK